MTVLHTAEPRPDHKVIKRGGKNPIAIKVYLVLQRINVARDGQVNSRVIAARLTKSAADDVVCDTAGTWVEKHTAVKYIATRCNNMAA